MKEAILKAIKGGWNDRLYRNYKNFEVNDEAGILTHHSSLLLDPLFWQSLGEATGNGLNNNPDNIYNKTGEIIFWWHYQWLRFIDHIAAGGSEDEFFNQLLK